jgi:uncharacterized protein (TIGR02271 family)
VAYPEILILPPVPAEPRRLSFCREGSLFMSKTVTSLFRSPEAAADVVTRLEKLGIGRDDITVHTGSDSSFVSSLDDLGVPRSDAQAYAEGVRRGGCLVVVECDDEEVDRVTSVMDGEGVLDLDERQSAWRSEGWAGGLQEGQTGAMAAGRTGSSIGRSETETARATGAGRSNVSGDSGRDEVIPVAEEELHVGTREVGRGRVRIHSRVVERPVQEQVTLRDETIEVERRPTSGRAVSGDPFQERTIEVEERDEEAVVSKDARVKEELVVRKDVEQRSKTISDTVRKTEVDIEDTRNTRGTGTTDAANRKR